MGTETTQKLLAVTLEGPRGPAYLRFSEKPVQYIEHLSGPSMENESVVVDVAGDGKL